MESKEIGLPAEYFIWQLTETNFSSPFEGCSLDHRYLGSVICAFKDTLTMTLCHKIRFNTSVQGFKKDPIRYQCYLY